MTSQTRVKVRNKKQRNVTNAAEMLDVDVVIMAKKPPPLLHGRIVVTAGKHQNMRRAKKSAMGENECGE